MRWRIAMTISYGLLLGGWLYFNAWSYERPDSLHIDSPLAGIAVMLLTILTGFLVARPWVLLSLLAPIVSLGYLQSTGKRGPDGVSPLTSPPGIFHIIWFALLLGLGIWLSSLWRQFKDWRSLRST
jgi:hypothetical protein